MEDTKVYKKVIDKQKLQEYCMGMPIDDSHIEALILLTNVILVKYFPTLYRHFKDLRQYMLLKAAEIRYTHHFYDDQNAYNFLYTTFINDVKNKIYKFSKDPNFDDILSSVISVEKSNGKSDFSDVVVSTHEVVSNDFSNFDTFKEISDYFPYLSGELHFVKKRIPAKDVLNLLLFLRLHEKKVLSSVNLPGFISDEMDSDATRALYKLSSDLISIFSDGDNGNESEVTRGGEGACSEG